MFVCKSKLRTALRHGPLPLSIFREQVKRGTLLRMHLHMGLNFWARCCLSDGIAFAAAEASADTVVRTVYWLLRSKRPGVPEQTPWLASLRSSMLLFRAALPYNSQEPAYPCHQVASFILNDTVREVKAGTSLNLWPRIRKAAFAALNGADGIKAAFDGQHPTLDALARAVATETLDPSKPVPRGKWPFVAEPLWVAVCAAVLPIAAAMPPPSPEHSHAMQAKMHPFRYLQVLAQCAQVSASHFLIIALSNNMPSGLFRS